MKAQKTVFMAELAVLIALIILLAFTPLGYLRVLAISITFIPIPVIIGAVILGPTAGAILGGVFGLTSFIQCLGSDPFGVALFAISPFYTFLLCIPTRILMGWLTGLVAKKMQGKGLAAFTVPSALGPLLNTVFFTATLMLLFWNAPILVDLRNGFGTDNVLLFFFMFIGINALVELISCTVIATAVSKALSHVNKKQLG